jgi:hypothetical protein
MQELQSLLARREKAVAVDFDHLNHRVRCYAHIINICSSHIIASMTPTSKSYLSQLKVPISSSYVTRDNSDDESDDGDDLNPDYDTEELADCYADWGDSNLKRWFSGIKRDPLRRARRVIRFLRSSDQRKADFRAFIEDGNRRSWFSMKDSDGKRVALQVSTLELLRDVKTRWDSVFMMLERLRELRPVSLPY